MDYYFYENEYSFICLEEDWLTVDTLHGGFAFVPVNGIIRNSPAFLSTLAATTSM